MVLLEKMLPVNELGNDKLEIRFGLVFEYKPKTPTLRSGQHLVVTDSLSEDPSDPSFSAARLQTDEEGNLFWMQPGTTFPQQVGNLIGIIPTEDMISAGIKGLEIYFGAHIPQVMIEAITTLSQKPPKTINKT